MVAAAKNVARMSKSASATLDGLVSDGIIRQANQTITSKMSHHVYAASLETFSHMAVRAMWLRSGARASAGAGDPGPRRGPLAQERLRNAARYGNVAEVFELLRLGECPQFINMPDEARPLDAPATVRARRCLFIMQQSMSRDMHCRDASRTSGRRCIGRPTRGTKP